MRKNHKKGLNYIWEQDAMRSSLGIEIACRTKRIIAQKGRRSKQDLQTALHIYYAAGVEEIMSIPNWRVSLSMAPMA